MPKGNLDDDLLRNGDDGNDTGTDNNDQPITPPDDGNNDGGNDGGNDTPTTTGEEPDFARYVKLIRDGYTLADIIKIYGIETGVDFGYPKKPYAEDVDDDGNPIEVDFNGKEIDVDRSNFFEECACKTSSTDQQGGDASGDATHTIDNCEEELKDGKTFFDFMLAKAAKYFPEEDSASTDPSTDPDAGDTDEEDEFKFNLNNDAYGLNPEEDVENGQQFEWNEEAEGDNKPAITIPRTLEEFAEWANIEPEDETPTPVAEYEDYIGNIVERLNMFFAKEAPVSDTDEEEVEKTYADEITKLFGEFFYTLADASSMTDEEKAKYEEELENLAYYTKVAKGVINPEDADEIVNGVTETVGDEEFLFKTFLNKQFWEFKEALIAAEEEGKFDPETVRGWILKYARIEDTTDDPETPDEKANRAFKRFLRLGFGEFMAAKFDACADEELQKDMIDFIAYYQYKDAQLRKLAMDTIAKTEPGSEFDEKTPEFYQIPGFDKIPVKDYVQTEDKTWIEDYRVESTKTEEKEVTAEISNWIDPAVKDVELKDGKFTGTVEVEVPTWKPFEDNKELYTGYEFKPEGVVNPNEPVDPADQGGATGYDSSTNYDNPDQDINLNGNGETISNGASITGKTVTTDNLNINSTSTENVEPITITAADTASVSNANISSTSPVTISSANGTDLTGASIQSEGTTSIVSTNGDTNVTGTTVTDSGAVTVSGANVNVTDTTFTNSNSLNINANNNVTIDNISVANGSPVNIDANNDVFIGPDPNSVDTENLEPINSIESTVLNITSGSDVYITGTETSGAITGSNATISINMKENN